MRRGDERLVPLEPTAGSRRLCMDRIGFRCPRVPTGLAAHASGPTFAARGQPERPRSAATRCGTAMSAYYLYSDFIYWAQLADDDGRHRQRVGGARAFIEGPCLPEEVVTSSQCRRSVLV